MKSTLKKLGRWKSRSRTVKEFVVNRSAYYFYLTISVVLGMLYLVTLPFSTMTFDEGAVAVLLVVSIILFGFIILCLIMYQRAYKEYLIQEKAYDKVKKQYEETYRLFQEYAEKTQKEQVDTVNCRSNEYSAEENKWQIDFYAHIHK